MRLEELKQIFGGRIRELGERRWLDARVGGLRAFIVSRITSDGVVTFDLAVFTPQTRELEPFFARDEGQEWRLDGERVLPRLREGFLCEGCRRGILFASSIGEPSLDGIISTLWELAEWARRPWHPVVSTPKAEAARRRERARIQRDRWIRLGWVVMVVVLVLWLRADAARMLFALVTAAATYPREATMA